MSSTDKIDLEKWQTRAQIAMTDLWYFLKFFARTKDEHDSTVTYKPFPEKALYRVLCRVIAESGPIVIDKSRQVMMTWFFCGMLLHDAMFKKNRLNFIQSKKEADSQKTLKRVKHMVEGLIPIWPLKGLVTPKMTGTRIGTEGELTFEENKSDIVGIPQGSDIVRQHTCSNIFADEINHQRDAGETYDAAKPTLSGGGRWFGVGTPNGKNDIYRMLYNIDDRTNKPRGEHRVDSRKVNKKLFYPPDYLSEEMKRRWVEKHIVEMKNEQFNSIPLEELVASTPGIDYWLTTKGITGVLIHYSADPDKSPETAKGRDWIAREREECRTPGAWEREYELCHDTYEGRAVIGNWARDIFVKGTQYDPSLPIHIGVDFGSDVCCAAFGQYVPVPGFNARQVQIMDEIVLYNSNTVVLAEMINEKLRDQFPNAADDRGYIKCHPDPAGNQRRETTASGSENTSIKILQNHGIKCYTRKLSVRESTDLVKVAFSKILPDDTPAIRINPRCTYLIGVFRGGWHYPEVDDGKRTGIPEKDGEWDHGGDTARHLIANMVNPRDFGETRQRQKFVSRKRRVGGVVYG